MLSAVSRVTARLPPGADGSRTAIIQALQRAMWNEDACVCALGNTEHATGMRADDDGFFGMERAIEESLAHTNALAAIQSRVSELGRRLVDVDRTGHCQFDALARQVRKDIASVCACAACVGACAVCICCP